MVNCPLNSSPNLTTFDCECDPGYAGNTCEEINECGSNPCENGGTCTDLINDFSCVCAPGYTGDTCMINIDECDPTPCLNGGTCTDHINDFSCICAPSYTGDTCDCAYGLAPCCNVDTCTDVMNNSCLDYWNGTLCEPCNLNGCKECSLSVQEHVRTVCSKCMDGFILESGRCGEHSLSPCPQGRRLARWAL